MARRLRRARRVAAAAGLVAAGLAAAAMALVACLGLAACEPFSAPIERPNRTVEGCQDAVDHLRSCCPGWNRYLSCTYLTNERASPDLTTSQIKCLSQFSCNEIQCAVAAGDLCDLTPPTRQCQLSR